MAYNLAQPTQILFNMRQPKLIGSIQIDTFDREQHHSSAKVTDYPIESGASISDHVIVMPDELTISGMIGPVALFSLISQSATRIIDVDQQLLALKNGKTPVTVVTGLRVYTNMVIQDYRVDRDKDTGANLIFDMIFKQAVIIASQLTATPSIGGTPDTQDQAQGGQSSGTQTGLQIGSNSAIYQAIQKGRQAGLSLVGSSGTFGALGQP